MIYPTIDQLTKGELNRYELVIGVAICARIVPAAHIVGTETYCETTLFCRGSFLCNKNPPGNAVGVYY